MILTVDMGVIDRFLQELPDKALRFGVKVVLAIVTFLIGVQIIKIVRKVFKKAMGKANAEQGVIQFLDSFIKIMLYLLLFVMLATSFGVSVAGVVTLLGFFAGKREQSCRRCADSSDEAVPCR